MGLQLKSHNLLTKKAGGNIYKGAKMHFGFKSSCTSGLWRGAGAISPRGSARTRPAHVARSRALTSRHDGRAMGIRWWGLNVSVWQPRVCQVPTSASHQRERERWGDRILYGGPFGKHPNTEAASNGPAVVRHKPQLSFARLSLLPSLSSPCQVGSMPVAFATTRDRCLFFLV